MKKTNQNSPLQAAIYEIIIFPAIWLILAIYWQIINLYFIDFSSFLWHNFNIYRHEFQNSILFHDYVLLFSNLLFAQTNTGKKQTSTNPVFDGWYADPEGVVFGDKYWIYPTYSAPFEQQLYMDAFSSPDLVHTEKNTRKSFLSKKISAG